MLNDWLDEFPVSSDARDVYELQSPRRDHDDQSNERSASESVVADEPPRIETSIDVDDHQAQPSVEYSVSIKSQNESSQRQPKRQNRRRKNDQHQQNPSQQHTSQPKPARSEQRRRSPARRTSPVRVAVFIRACDLMCSLQDRRQNRQFSPFRRSRSKSPIRNRSRSPARYRSHSVDHRRRRSPSTDRRYRQRSPSPHRDRRSRQRSASPPRTSPNVSTHDLPDYPRLNFELRLPGGIRLAECLEVRALTNAQVDALHSLTQFWSKQAEERVCIELLALAAAHPHLVPNASKYTGSVIAVAPTPSAVPVSTSAPSAVSSASAQSQVAAVATSDVFIRRVATSAASSITAASSAPEPTRSRVIRVIEPDAAGTVKRIVTKR